MQQIAMSRVNFEHAVTGLQRAARSFSESSDHIRNVPYADFTGHWIVRRKWHGTWREHVLPAALSFLHSSAAIPGTRGAGLAPRVRQLYACRSPLRMNEPHD